MPKVRILETTDGSPDGISMVTYKKDQVVNIPDDLYRNFQQMGVVERVNEKPESTVENKAELNVTENKTSDEGENTDGQTTEGDENTEESTDSPDVTSEVSGEANLDDGNAERATGFFGRRKG